MRNRMTENGDRKMTTAEVCQVLCCDKVTLMRNWREIETVSGAETVKSIEHGKTTYWSEAEVTLLLEKMKVNTKNQYDLPSSLDGIDTSKSRVLRLQVLQKQMQEIYEAEISELRAENEVQKERLAIVEPKAEVYDLTADTKGAFSVSETAKVLKLPFGSKTLFKKLREMRVLMADNVPYQDFINRGYFVVDQYLVQMRNNSEVKKVTKVTAKGRYWLARIFGKVPEKELFEIQ